jgi:hypothetical protein
MIYADVPEFWDTIVAKLSQECELANIATLSACLDSVGYSNPEGWDLIAKRSLEYRFHRTKDVQSYITIRNAVFNRNYDPENQNHTNFFHEIELHATSTLWGFGRSKFFMLTSNLRDFQKVKILPNAKPTTVPNNQVKGLKRVNSLFRAI